MNGISVGQGLPIHPTTVIGMSNFVKNIKKLNAKNMSYIKFNNFTLKTGSDRPGISVRQVRRTAQVQLARRLPFLKFYFVHGFFTWSLKNIVLQNHIS